ncbi:hypothetical protein ACI2L1_13040 [Streptomyces sp. NPDC019531]|uniref:hypothetical protein n=1 Tax=Streptomyces sp. NPDC019531 TaxID=3365062 RepID=UPI00384F7523
MPSDRRPGPGKLSVSLAATSMPRDNGRGRRLSCTVALAVAGALAAVTVGSVFVFDLLPGRGGDDTASSDAGSGTDAYSSAPASSAPSASATSASPSSSAAASGPAVSPPATSAPGRVRAAVSTGVCR